SCTAGACGSVPPQTSERPSWCGCHSKDETRSRWKRARCYRVSALERVERGAMFASVRAFREQLWLVGVVDIGGRHPGRSGCRSTVACLRRKCRSQSPENTGKDLANTLLTFGKVRFKRCEIRNVGCTREQRQQPGPRRFRIERPG